MNTMDFVTLGVAIYAALAATIVGCWTAYGVWRDRSSMKIDVRFGYVIAAGGHPYLKVSPDVVPEEIFEENTRLVITARNTGRRPIHLSGGGLRYKDGTQTGFMGEGLGKTFPLSLDEGKSGDTWSYLSRTRKRLIREGIKPPIWAYFQTEAGRTYKSKVSKKIVKVLLADS